MSTILLKEKNPLTKPNILTLDEAIAFIRKHFQDSMYGSRREFCAKHKKIKYATLNSIITNRKVPTAMPVNKITDIFIALGYNCIMEKTITFTISPKIPRRKPAGTPKTNKTTKIKTQDSNY